MQLKPHECILTQRQSEVYTVFTHFGSKRVTCHVLNICENTLNRYIASIRKRLRFRTDREMINHAKYYSDMYPNDTIHAVIEKKYKHLFEKGDAYIKESKELLTRPFKKMRNYKKKDDFKEIPVEKLDSDGISTLAEKLGVEKKQNLLKNVYLLKGILVALQEVIPTKENLAPITNVLIQDIISYIENLGEK